MGRAFALSVLVLLGGCAAATPITYLRLSEVPGEVRATPAGKAVSVAHVEMPPSIDRLQLTSETGPTTLDLAPNAEWAAPLGGMATRVLAQDLAARLPRTHVVMPGDVAPSGGARIVRVNVLRFLPIVSPAGTQVALDADWQVLSPSGAVAREGRSLIRIASAPGAPAAAQAMSAALGELADRIAAALSGR